MIRRITIRNFLLIAILAVILGLAVRMWTHRREAPPEVPPESMPADTDLALRDIQYTETSGGVRRWTLTAESAAYSADQGESAVKNLHLEFFDRQGRKQMVLTAREGFWKSERGTIEALGDVVVDTAEGYRLYTERLIYRTDQNEVSTDEPVRVESKGLRLTARGMRFGVKSRRLKLHSHVRAVLPDGIRSR